MKRIIISLLLTLLFNVYADQSKKGNDYFTEFKANKSFTLFKKKEVILPNGHTITQLLPVKKLPEGLRYEEESSLEYCGRILNKYAFPLTVELAMVAALFFAKQFLQEKNDPNRTCIDILEKIAQGKLASTALGLGHDIFSPHIKVTESVDINAQQKAAQFFEKTT
jgi:hypothetical protein